MTITDINLADIPAERDRLDAEARAILTRADGGTLSDEDRARVDAIKADLAGLAERQSFLEVATRNHAAGAFESGDFSTGLQHMRRIDPHDGTPFERLSPLEARDRTRAAIDGLGLDDRSAERAEKAALADRTPTTTRQLLATSSPAYEEAWKRWLVDPQGAPTSFTDAERAAVREAELVRTSLQLGNTGAYITPAALDPTIRLTNNGAINPFREIADVRTITNDQLDLVTSAGVTAEWLGEAVESADATPALGQASITAHKASAYVQASYEAAMDSNFPEQVARLISDAKDRLEATAFALGSGSGQPYGAVTRLAATTASRVAGSSGSAGAADFVVGDVYALKDALPPRYRQNASWLAEGTIYGKVRQFATGTGPSHAFWTDLGADRPPLLLGRPTYESSAMDSTIVSGSNDDVLTLGDFRQGYVIADRLGMAIAPVPVVMGANRRPTAEQGWFAYWRVGGDLVDTNAARLLRL